MEDRLTRDEIEKLLQEVTGNLRFKYCRTCECFQGLITQLELEAGEDATGVTAQWKVSQGELHGCLGCDPCPPGASFADYLKRSS